MSRDVHYYMEVFTSNRYFVLLYQENEKLNLDLDVIILSILKAIMEMEFKQTSATTRPTMVNSLKLYSMT